MKTLYDEIENFKIVINRLILKIIEMLKFKEFLKWLNNKLI